MTQRTKFLRYFFFFQAEDGIRDYKVTGVQTCALPISCRTASATTSSPGTSSPPSRSDPGTSLGGNSDSVRKPLSSRGPASFPQPRHGTTTQPRHGTTSRTHVTEDRHGKTYDAVSRRCSVTPLRDVLS